MLLWAMLGEYPSTIKDELLKQPEGYCYDVSNKKFVDSMGSGLLDPAKVIRCALENSLSVVSVLMSSNFAIVEE